MRAPARPMTDGITLEVIGSALAAIAEEMGIALIRSAYSTNVKERRDCSAGSRWTAWRASSG